jgi:hypothetical protein
LPSDPTNSGTDGNHLSSPLPGEAPTTRPGATTFIAEIAPDPTTGYDFSSLEEMLAWRDRQGFPEPFQRDVEPRLRKLG